MPMTPVTIVPIPVHTFKDNAYFIEGRPEVILEHDASGWRVTEHGVAGRIDESVEWFDAPEDAAAAWAEGLIAWDSNR